jgi:hypothetical protein
MSSCHIQTCSHTVCDQQFFYPPQFSSDLGAFTCNVLYERCTELITVPLKFVLQLADGLQGSQPQIVLLSNTSRCGSTLLTQMFEAVLRTVTISEPSFLVNIVTSSWKIRIAPFTQVSCISYFT